MLQLNHKVDPRINGERQASQVRHVMVNMKHPLSPAVGIKRCRRVFAVLIVIIIACPSRFHNISTSMNFTSTLSESIYRTSEHVPIV